MALIAAVLWALARACPLQAQELFAEVVPDPPSVYEGEPFTLRLLVYRTGQNLDPDLRLTGLPTSDRLQLQTFHELAPTRREIGGRAYDVLGYETEALCPAPGSVTIHPTLQATLVRTVGSYFLVHRERRAVSIPVTPLELAVKPVPLAGAPADFSGAVGRLAFSASVEPTQAAPGDLLTLTQVIRGRVRLEGFLPRGLASSDQLKAYEVKLEHASSDERRYSQVVIPLAAPLAPLPPVSFTFFDTGTGSFRTEAAGPFPLRLREEDVSVPALPVIPRPPATASPAAPEPADVKTNSAAWRLAPPAGAAPAAASEATRLLDAGRAAYARGAYGEALDAYAKVLGLGFSSGELAYNVGTCYLRAGRTGPAVLFLRRAWRVLPRDPDVRRNLALALRDEPPGPPWPLGLLPDRTWRRAAWVLALAAGLLLLLPVRTGRRRAVRGGLLTACLLGLALAAVGAAAWQRPSLRSEWVVVDGPVRARLAPAGTANATSTVAEGQLVVLLEQQGDWARIAAPAGRGWVPARTVAPVRPAPPAAP